MFPKEFLNYQKKLKDFKCRDDDIWVASFPKCGERSVYYIHSQHFRVFLWFPIAIGTTWTIEMVYLLVNDLDYDKATAKTQENRVPFTE